MAKYRVLVITLLVAGLFVWANPALADGIIIPDPPIWPEPPPMERTWLTIRYHRVSVEIKRLATSLVAEDAAEEAVVAKPAERATGLVGRLRTALRHG